MIMSFLLKPNWKRNVICCLDLTEMILSFPAGTWLIGHVFSYWNLAEMVMSWPTET